MGSRKIYDRSPGLKAAGLPSLRQDISSLIFPKPNSEEYPDEPVKKTFDYPLPPARTHPYDQDKILEYMYPPPEIPLQDVIDLVRSKDYILTVGKKMSPQFDPKGTFGRTTVSDVTEQMKNVLIEEEKPPAPMSPARVKARLISSNHCGPGEQKIYGFDMVVRKKQVDPYEMIKAKAGTNTKEVLEWDPQCLSCATHKTILCRESLKPKLGQVKTTRDHIAEKMPEGWVFGRANPQNPSAKHMLMADEDPSDIKDLEDIIKYIMELKYKLKKLRPHFDYNLFFKTYVQRDDGTYMPTDELLRNLKEHGLAIDMERLYPYLIRANIILPDGSLDCYKFFDIIDPFSKFPHVAPKTNLSSSQFSTTYQRDMVFPKAPIKEDVGVKLYKSSTLPGNRITAQDCLQPTTMSYLGLTEHDFFKPRAPEFLMRLSEVMGHKMTPKIFDMIWDMGFKRDGTGGVCANTFFELVNQLSKDEKYKAYFYKPVHKEE